MSRHLQYLALVAFLAVNIAPTQAAGVMSNQDIINMYRAKLSESLIITTIEAATPGFDTSPDALIQLSMAGVSEAVIKAVIEATNAGARPSPNAAAAGRSGLARGAFNPEEVVVADGGQDTSLRYIAPQKRVAARGLGFGGLASYMVLSGTRAAKRVASRQPTFLLAVPSNAQPESYYTLASFAVRPNNTREVLVGGGGGFYSYSTGVTRDRIMPTSAERLSDQSKAPNGFTIYKISVTRPLAIGEYGLILYNSQVGVTGFFGTGVDSCFDFGIDA